MNKLREVSQFLSNGKKLSNAKTVENLINYGFDASVRLTNGADNEPDKS
jgi:hypothetical protein